MILGRNARRADKYREELIGELLKENQRLREEIKEYKDEIAYMKYRKTRKVRKNG